jgi:uncharacterized protein YndB with AHSA1/START domain
MTEAAMKTATQEILVEEMFPHAPETWQGGHDGNGQRYGSLLRTIVTWTLAKVDGGTRLRLVHSGFVTPRNDSAFRNMSEGWKKVVGRIGAMSGEQPETTGIAETRK